MDSFACEVCEAAATPDEKTADAEAQQSVVKIFPKSTSSVDQTLPQLVLHGIHTAGGGINDEHCD